MQKVLVVGLLVMFVLLSAAQQPEVVPSDYRKRLQTATPAQAIDSLGWASLTVQAQVGRLRADTAQGLRSMQTQIEQVRLDANKSFGQIQGGMSQIDKRMTATETLINQISPPVEPAAFYKQVQDLKAETVAIKKQLADLQAAACPVLKSATVKDDDAVRIAALCP